MNKTWITVIRIAFWNIFILDADWQTFYMAGFIWIKLILALFLAEYIVVLCVLLIL